MTYTWNLIPAYIADILMIIILLYYGFSNRHLSPSAKSFRLCLYLSLAVININIASVYCIMYSTSIPLFLNYIIQTMDFVFSSFLSMLIFKYLIESLYVNNPDSFLHKISMFFLYVVTISFELLFVANIYTGSIFYFTAAKEYVRGPLNQIIIIMYILHLGFMTAGFILNRKYADRHVYKMALVGIGAATLVVFLQYFYRDVMFASLGSSLALLVIFISSQQNLIGIDGSTNVFNRLSFYYKSISLIKSKKAYTILLVDLQRAQNVISVYDYANFEHLLKEMGKFLWRWSPNNVFLLRSNRFAILLPANKSYLIDQDYINNRFNKPWQIPNGEVIVDVRYGIYNSETLKTTSSEELMSQLDYLFDLLKTNQNIDEVTFTAELWIQHQREQRIIELVKESLIKDRFYLNYQPIFDQKNKCCVGVEALIRMRDPDGAIISPATFIPLAEHSELIVDIGYWVIDEVCKFLNKNIVPAHCFVSINISIKQFIQDDFVEKFLAITEKYNVKANRIKLEITEYTLLNEESYVVDNIYRFNKLGVGIFIDDFGSGYSNLVLLSKLPIECVKFDRSLIKDLVEDSDSYKIIKSLIAGFSQTKIHSLVEGVETLEHMDLLKGFKVSMLQGFYLSVPLDVKDLKSISYTN